MRTTIVPTCLLALICVMASGCRSTVAPRAPQIRTIASIGDRPQSAGAGEPGRFAVDGAGGVGEDRRRGSPDQRQGRRRSRRPRRQRQGPRGAQRIGRRPGDPGLDRRGGAVHAPRPAAGLRIHADRRGPGRQLGRPSLRGDRRSAGADHAQGRLQGPARFGGDRGVRNAGRRGANVSRLSFDPAATAAAAGRIRRVPRSVGEPGVDRTLRRLARLRVALEAGARGAGTRSQCRARGTGRGTDAGTSGNPRHAQARAEPTRTR